MGTAEPVLARAISDADDRLVMVNAAYRRLYSEDEAISQPGQRFCDIIRHCLGRLAKFKVPQSVTFVDALPRNATGKVLKAQLQEKLGV